MAVRCSKNARVSTQKSHTGRKNGEKAVKNSTPPPTAPSSSANERGRWKTSSITAEMAAAAVSDSSAVTISTRAPLFFSVSHLK